MKKCFLSFLALLAGLSLYAAEFQVSGVVRDDSGKPVSGVKVTDGYNFVLTDNNGRYRICPHDDANFVYISIPSGFEMASRNGAPFFYRSLKREQESQKQDFDLLRLTQDDTHHQFVLWADVQVYNESELELVSKAASDARDLVKENGLSTFGMSCGDIVGNWSSGMLETVHKTCAQAGFPFFTLMGNHDYQAGVATNEESKRNYTDTFGPTYYSFDKGRLHYVVLDDVFYFSRHYMGYLEQAQLEWLKKDLSYVTEGSTVVLFMHIPTYSKEARAGQFNKEEYNRILCNRQALYDILAPYNAHICSAHEHYAENYVLNEHLFEHVHAPLSGLFWQSLYSCDGLPWGYYVYEVDGDGIVDWYYKAIGESRDVQFSAYRLGEDPMKAHSVVANVWNYDPSWKVEWRENGVDQGAMEKYSGWDRNIVSDVEARREKEFTWKYIGAAQTEHLFCATPSSIDSEVEIVVTDRFGRVYTWNNSRDKIYQTSSYTLSSDKLTEGGKEYRAPQPAVYPEYGRFYGADKMETNLYNLSISEMVKNKESDGTFRTGELWSGVWTRDVSYSAILGLAHLEPEVIKTSLMRKVDRKNRIIQDTGTGGSWPCSSDRVVWIIAAYEVYLETGDISWLKQIYPIAKRSLDADMIAVYNSQTGLFRGESSFIDWREQSYPKWMQPADIAASECLGTNAVYYRALQIMSSIAGKLGPTRSSEAKRYAQRAAELKAAINEHFWLEKEGYYAQYIYGRNARYISPRSETLGESLCILWDIASPEQAARILSNMEVCDYGPTIFSPQISAIGSYHNDAIWPFVTSYYGLAAAKSGNRDALMHALASNMRAATFFGSNMENMVASSGGKETALNSTRQLWSVAGFSGLYRNALLGINYEDEGIRLKPCVPAQMKACRKIENFKYRDMLLDIEVVGEGNVIKECQLDGKNLPSAFIPASLSGKHTVFVILGPAEAEAKAALKISPVLWDLDYPEAVLNNGVLSWNAVRGATYYKVYCNGLQQQELSANHYTPVTSGEYTVMAFDEHGRYSFISEPVRVNLKEQFYKIEDLSLENKLGVQWKQEVNIPKTGEYYIEFEYSNGNGDISTYNKCSTRTLFIDRKRADVVVLPQRGDSWDAKGFTQPVKVKLSAGNHSLELRFLEENINMNIDVDNVVLRGLRISKLD